MRLLPGTPQCVSLFLAGSLSGKALLHLRQLSIFGMICRLKSDVLYKHAVHTLTVAKPSSNSGFLQIRNLCLQYNLPHPLVLLRSNLSKEALKEMIKKHVTNFWEHHFREEAADLLSLHYFKPGFMTLKVTHPIFTSAGPSHYFVTMASVQAVM